MATTPNFSQPAIFSEVSTPTAPDSGYLKVYAKSGALYSIANGASEKAYATSTDLSSYLPLAGGTLVGDLKFTDATYDIGKSGATRPRDGFFSRNVTIGGTATFAGAIVADGVAWTGKTFYQTGYSSVGWGLSAGNWYFGNGASDWKFGLHASSGVQIFSGTLGFNGNLAGSANDLEISRDAADILAQRRGTNPQTFRLAETWTSSTSFGALQIKANTGAAYQIGSAIGSAGGTNREIQIGHWNSAGTFGALLNVATVGGVTIQPLTTTGSSLTVELGNNYDYTSPAFKMNRLGNTIGTIYMDGFWNFVIDTSRSASGGSVVKNIDIHVPTDKAFRVGNTVVSAALKTMPFEITGYGQIYSMPSALTALTASTEYSDVNFNLARTVQFATGALTTQRAFRIQAPVYSHVSGSNTITTASTVSISGPPTTTGGFTTITNAYALNVESGDSYFAGAIRLPSSSNGIYFSASGNSAGRLSMFGSEFYIDNAAAGGGFIFRVNSAVTSAITIPSTGIAEFHQGIRGTSHVLNVVSSTNAQTLRLFNTYTSSTSYETLNIKGKAGANFEIGPENGSAGGTLRGLTIGGYSAGSTTITPWLTFTNAGAATFSGIISTSNSGIILSEVIIRRSTAGGIIEIADNSENFNRLQLGGRTSAYPAIKRSSAAVALRLADDSADAALTCAGITASDSVTTNGLFSSDRYAVSANYRFRRANGTSSSPTQVTSGQAVGALSSFGYHDSGAFHSSAGALVYFVAAENFTSTAHGTNIQFWTTPTTSTTSAKRLCIEASGELTLEAGSHIQTSGAGIKIGTATSQKLGFWNATPVVQQVLATGTGATVDNVIALLQTLGLCKQS